MKLAFSLDLILGISTFNNFDGFKVIFFKIFIIETSDLFSKFNIIGSNVSIPDAPVEAEVKGRIFVSFDIGLWSDVITSIVSSNIAFWIAILSSSFLRGGDNLKDVL